jgi:hypothetical protein
MLSMTVLIFNSPFHYDICHKYLNYGKQNNPSHNQGTTNSNFKKKERTKKNK